MSTHSLTYSINQSIYQSINHCLFFLSLEDSITVDKGTFSWDYENLPVLHK